ncbi:caspase, EACC1-associated type [Actinophytocola sediminis]
MSGEPVIPPGSRAILIGVPRYQDAAYRSYPAVGNSVDGMRTLLVESGLCGWRPDQVTSFVNPTNAGKFLGQLRDLVRATTGVLLLYFVGHGVVSEQGELCLALADTDHANPDTTGLEYAKIKRMLYAGTPATTRIVILDSCFSGRAIGLGTVGGTQLADLSETSGTYTLTAADELAHVAAEGRHTAFTGELLDLLTRDGVPGGPRGLTLNRIYLQLRRRLEAKNLPRPNQRSEDTAAAFVLASNTVHPRPLGQEVQRRAAPATRLSRRHLLTGAAGVGAVAALGFLGREVFSDDHTVVPGEEKWRFSTRGAVSSTPAVAAGVVYVGSDDGNLYAVDVASGQQRWQPYPLGGMARSSPVVAAGVVYVGSDSGNLFAIDAASGEPRWRRPLHTEGALGWSSPVLAGGSVYVGSEDQHLYAVDAGSGEQHWRFPARGTIWGPAVADGVVYLGSADHHLYAVDTTTGEERWSFQADDVVWRPAVADGVVYFGSDDRNLYAVDVTTGSERWAQDFAARVTTTPVVAGGVVYVGGDDDHLYAVDARDGEPRWRLRTDGDVRSTAAVAGDVVYVGSNDGNLYAAATVDGTERWHTRVGDTLWSSPVVADGVVYIGSDLSFLYAANA